MSTSSSTLQKCYLLWLKSVMETQESSTMCIVSRLTSYVSYIIHSSRAGLALPLPPLSRLRKYTKWLVALDRVQRCATRITGDEEISSHLEPLQQRREFASFSAFYRMYHARVVFCQCSDELFNLILLSPFPHTSTRAGDWHNDFWPPPLGYSRLDKYQVEYGL